MNIPKIIHFIAPADKSRWHPMWNRCYPSWLEHFRDFEHRLYNDNSDIERFVYTHYPKYYNMFMEFPAHIMRIDFVRFCLLHYYGGIYSDMDMYCYKNFYDELTHPLHIVEAPYGDEFLESSLMMSEPKHEFWKDCMDLSYEVFYSTIKKHDIKIPFNNNRATQYLLVSACGPNLICRVWRKWAKTKPDQLQTLAGVIYNNHGMSYHKEYRTKHLMTGMWGKESVDYIEQCSDKSKTLEQTLDEIYISEMQKYVQLNGIKSIEDFDFYHDYTNGRMKTHFVPDLDISDIDNQPTGANFNYG
jgi:mannosyltransferase OCH1-like enzyme